MNYQELQDQIALFLNRTDLAGQIPTFVSLAEDRIFNEIRCRYNITTLAYPAHTGATIPIPADFKKAQYVHWGDNELQKRVIVHPNYYTTLHNTEQYTGYPLYWSDNGENLVLQPKLDAPYDLSLTYFKTLKGTLVNDTDTNALLTAAPNLYLYACLVVGESYLKGDPSLYNAQYVDALNGLNNEYKSNVLTVTENAS